MNICKLTHDLTQLYGYVDTMNLGNLVIPVDHGKCCNKLTSG